MPRRASRDNSPVLSRGDSGQVGHDIPELAGAIEHASFDGLLRCRDPRSRQVDASPVCHRRCHEEPDRCGRRVHPRRHEPDAVGRRRGRGASPRRLYARLATSTAGLSPPTHRTEVRLTAMHGSPFRPILCSTPRSARCREHRGTHRRCESRPLDSDVTSGRRSRARPRRQAHPTPSYERPAGGGRQRTRRRHSDRLSANR